MTSSLAKTLKLVLLSSVVALGVARNADAAYVVINADPAYGSQFPGLSWRAVGALYIPDLCLGIVTALNTPPGIAINPFTVNLGQAWPLCSLAQIQDVKLQFYNTASGAVVDTLNIGTYKADLPPANFNHDLTIQELIGFTFKNGALDGFSTTLSTPMLSAAASAYSATPGAGSRCFALELSSATARVESFNTTGAGTCGAIDPRPAGELSAGSPYLPSVTWGRSAFIDDPLYRAPGFTPLQVNGVPEPTSLALVMLALGAAVAGRRARRKSA